MLSLQPISVDVPLPATVRQAPAVSPWYAYVPVQVVARSAGTASVSELDAMWEEDAERWDGMA